MTPPPCPCAFQDFGLQPFPACAVVRFSIAQTQPSDGLDTSPERPPVRHLAAAFKMPSGRRQVVGLGTGQAIDMGRRGDAACCLCMTRLHEEKVMPKVLPSSAPGMYTIGLSSRPLTPQNQRQCIVEGAKSSTLPTPTSSRGVTRRHQRGRVSL